MSQSNKNIPGAENRKIIDHVNVKILPNEKTNLNVEITNPNKKDSRWKDPSISFLK